MTALAADRRRYNPDSPRSHRMVDDRGWALVEAFFASESSTGRPPEWPVRLVFEALLHLLRTGCQWRMLPAEFPPRSTVHRYFSLWRDSGTIERMNHDLVMADRLREGREASPTAMIIDSQTVKTTETGGTKGYDGGKKINGMKRHILVDVSGRLLLAAISPTDWHGSRAGVILLRASRRYWPFVLILFADRGYAGEKMATATSVAVTIVSGPKNQKGFIVQKRRWVVERTFGWIVRSRRLGKDYERLGVSSLAYLVLAAAMNLVKRLAKS